MDPCYVFFVPLLPLPSAPKIRSVIMSRGIPRTFAVQPISRFTGSSPGYTRPTEVTSYSYDEHRRLHHDDRALAYYHAARAGEADLNQGYPDRYTKRDDGVDERLDGLCEAIQRARRRERAGSRSKGGLSADVVGWGHRG